jgi:hypothetical protein
MAQEAVKKVKRPRSIGPAAPKGVTVYRDLEYGKAGHQATLLHDALTKADVQSSLELVDGAGHNPGAPGQRERIVAFFDKHLKTHD